MDIILYNTVSDKRNLTKTLTDPLTLSISMKEPTQYKPFDVELSKGTGAAAKNYAFVPDLQSYYFLSTKEYGNGYLKLSFTLDVRMTFAPQIRALSGTVARNENVKNGYIMDGAYKSLIYKKVVTRPFPNGMTNDSLVLMTVG